MNKENELTAALATIEKLRAECDKMAAENVALKESRNNLAEFIHEELDADYPLNMNLETPATDRIYAGIKADGVDSGIKTIITMLNHRAPGVIDAINVLGVHSFELREVAK